MPLLGKQERVGYALVAMRAVISAVLRRYPFYSRYPEIALSRPLGLFARGEHALAKLRDGQRILVHTKDHVGRILLYMGDVDPRLSWVARKLLRPGDNVLDIGANLGWFTLLSSKLVGSRGQVHAFEPQPKIAAMLNASLAINGSDNVTLHDVALSDREGTAEFHVLGGNYGAGRLGDNDVTERWNTIRVQTVEAGTYLDSLDLPRVRLVKIDVEGHEQTIFEAAESFFRENQPDAILFEEAGSGTISRRPVAKVLKSFGYDLFTFNGSFTRPGLVSANADKPPSIDHLALRKGLHIL